MAYVRLGSFGHKRVLAGEFFTDGNIMLCDGDMKILALYSLEVRGIESSPSDSSMPLPRQTALTSLPLRAGS